MFSSVISSVVFGLLFLHQIVSSSVLIRHHKVDHLYSHHQTRSLVGQGCKDKNGTVKAPTKVDASSIEGFDPQLGLGSQPNSTFSYPPQKPHSSPTPSPSPSPSPTSSNSTPSTSTSSGTDQEAWLKAHNDVRAQHGANPVTWSTTLESFAEQVSEACNWEHTRNNQYGENYAAGQDSIESVVNDWVNGPEEIGSYRASAPVPSHFTQVVWKATTEIGCTKFSCSRLTGLSLPQSPIDFWVCEYNPPGNVQGEYAQNVEA